MSKNKLSSWARDAATSYEEAAFYLEGDTFDLCGGHATSEGWYHYHNTAGCLQEQAMAAAGTTSDEHSPQLGWSYVGASNTIVVEIVFCFVFRTYARSILATLKQRAERQTGSWAS